VTGKQACQGHSYDKATCDSVGCCRWNMLLGCRAMDADAQCFSDNPCDTTVAPGPSPPGPGKKVVAGGVIAGVIADHSGDYHHRELVEQPSVALDSSWNLGPVLSAGALRWRARSLHGR